MSPKTPQKRSASKAGRLTLNKKTVKDVSPRTGQAGQIRGGVPKSAARCGGGRCSAQESGCN